ncbi:MAG: YihA family ribosome biogenesis GTP-binding protein [Clostridia bacterium]|nr:YihA family ribosome biogenesis GTP-binding protein [Clostridia bacterium]MBR2969071.1 YihA family ribosome biogenesis GTP-binding protein [Clostridia bacterium]
MIIKKTEFITSAANRGGFIIPDKPMIAVCGKSNVGKSSFINMLARNGKLARTSNTPGRTRLVNYFDFGEFILADLPGYGFAKVSKEEKAKWAKLLESFFEHSEHISHVFSLMDIRHKPTADDMDMVAFLNHYILPFTVIATKADKLPKTRIKPAIRELAAHVKMAEGNVIATSAEDGRGRDAVLGKIESVIALSLSADDSDGEETEAQE